VLTRSFSSALVRLTIASAFLASLPVSLAVAQTKPADKDKKPAAAAPKEPAKPAAADPAPAAPNGTSGIKTTIFGEWALRCQKAQDNVHQNCEVSLTIQQKDQPAPIAKIALGQPIPGGGMKLLVLLPNNVTFPSSVQIKTDDKDIWGLDVPWARCIPGACFAETSLKDADLIRWKALDKSMGKITFKDAQSNEVGIAFSFNGLGQALDEFNKQLKTGE